VTKRVGWTDRAKAELRAIDQATALRILQSVSRYIESGNGDVKRIQAVEPPELRLRIGDYRVRFRDHGGTIVVTSVQHRREVYR
jgi:mRNA interferase RelE/StbE